MKRFRSFTICRRQLFIVQAFPLFYFLLCVYWRIFFFFGSPLTFMSFAVWLLFGKHFGCSEQGTGVYTVSYGFTFISFQRHCVTLHNFPTKQDMDNSILISFYSMVFVVATFFFFCKLYYPFSSFHAAVLNVSIFIVVKRKYKINNEDSRGKNSVHSRCLMLFYWFQISLAESERDE